MLLQNLNIQRQHCLTFLIPLISCCDAPVAGRGRICQSGSHVAWGSFSEAFQGIGGYFLLILLLNVMLGLKDGSSWEGPGATLVC